MSAVQRGISLCMSFVSSSGELATTSIPIVSCIFWRVSGAFRIFTISPLSLSTIGLGVPLGAYTACQDDISKSLMPASAIVGVSGDSGERVAVVTASSRSLPALTSGIPAVSWSNMNVTLPPATSCLACKVRRRARAGRCERALLVVRLEERDELLHVLDRQARIDVQRVGNEAYERDGLEILDGVVRQVLVEPGVDRVRADGAAEERVAVRLGLCDLARAD